MKSDPEVLTRLWASPIHVAHVMPLHSYSHTSGAGIAGGSGGGDGGGGDGDGGGGDGEGGGGDGGGGGCGGGGHSGCGASLGVAVQHQHLSSASKK